MPNSDLRNRFIAYVNKPGATLREIEIAYGAYEAAGGKGHVTTALAPKNKANFIKAVQNMSSIMLNTWKDLGFIAGTAEICSLNQVSIKTFNNIVSRWRRASFSRGVVFQIKASELVSLNVEKNECVMRDTCQYRLPDGFSEVCAYTEVFSPRSTGAVALSGNHFVKPYIRVIQKAMPGLLERDAETESQDVGHIANIIVCDGNLMR